MFLIVDVPSKDEGRSAHVTVSLTALENKFPVNGYLAIELISQVTLKCNHPRIVMLSSVSARASALTFTKFVSTESVYVKGNSLHFRVTFSEYFWYIDAVVLCLPDVPTVLLSAVVSSVVTYFLLISVEFSAFCTEKTDASRISSCADFTICSIKQFLWTKHDVLLNTWYVAVHSTVWEFIKFASIILMEVMFIATGELVFWNVFTANDLILATLKLIRRIGIIVIFSMVVNQYTLSWGRKITILHPLWLFKAYSYNVATSYMT